MKYHKAILFLIFISFRANLTFAQDPIFKLSLTDHFKLNQGINQAIGKDWNLKDYAVGDITNDKKEDLIVIGSPALDPEANGKIFLFINQGNNDFKIAATNVNIIECNTCGGMGVGDPYQNTIIKTAIFLLNCYMEQLAKMQLQ